MRYRSKPTEIEAMQWHTGNDYVYGRDFTPQQIVAWVNANGGEARYEPHHARIALRTINGWAFAELGHYVVEGGTWFDPYSTSGRGKAGKVRDFYPCDPETFEKRWEAE